MAEENKEILEETEEVKPTKKEKKDKHKVELEKLNEKLDEAVNEAAEWKDKYYRAYADIANLSKQNQKERQALLKYSSQSCIEKILPSLDIFSMVIGSVDNLPAEVRNYVMGFDVVYRQMIAALEGEGLSEISVKIGDEFDHNVHYATDTVEVEDEAMVDKITKINSKGYKLHDRLIRPAQVIVGKMKKEEVIEESEEPTVA